MSRMANYSSVSADASEIISARYGDSACPAIAVDTGFTVSFETEIIPFLKFITPDLIQPAPLQDNEVPPFAESELSQLMHLDNIANPILSDIWRDELNDEFVSS